jgi:hypothetical protein
MIKLKRFGGAPNGYPFAPLALTMTRLRRKQVALSIALISSVKYVCKTPIDSGFSSPSVDLDSIRALLSSHLLFGGVRVVVVVVARVESYRIGLYGLTPTLLPCPAVTRELCECWATR